MTNVRLACVRLQCGRCASDLNQRGDYSVAGTSKSTRAPRAKSTDKQDESPAPDDAVELKNPDAEINQDLVGEDRISGEETNSAENEEENPAGDVDTVSSEDTSEASDISVPAAETAAAPRPIFFPLVLGGICAAVIGFAAARYVIPEGWPTGAETTSEFAEQISAQGSRMDAIARQVAEMDGKIAGVSDGAISAVAEDLAAFRTELGGATDAINATLLALETRVAALEDRPVADGSGISAAMIDAYQKELEDLRASLEQQRAENEALAENISVVADKARAQIADVQKQSARLEARAAFSRIQAAMDSGASYSAALSEVAATGAEIPAALSAAAQSGVPTLASLQRSFPEAARAGLDASIKATVGTGALDKIGAFLKTQVGGRSLEPREGDDPDAVLSRAEANLRDGRLDEALSQLQTLPEEGRDAMTSWIDLAQSRIETLAAADVLSERLNKN